MALKVNAISPETLEDFRISAKTMSSEELENAINECEMKIHFSTKYATSWKDPFTAELNREKKMAFERELEMRY